MANQPERGEAYGSSHATHLAVASLAQFKAKPAGRDRTTLPNRRIAIADRLSLVIGKDPCFCRPGEASLNGDSPLELLELAVFGATLDLNPILTPVSKARIGEALLQPPVVGEQQQSFAVGIEAASSVNIRYWDQLR
tara:strand:- start:321 stop:731 length:411 start_codon:yes stop_codon:yes gene_type:complete